MFQSIGRAILRSIFGTQEEERELLYESSCHVLFSFYSDGALEKHYKPWRKRFLELQQDGILQACRKKGKRTVTHTLHLATCIVTLIDISDSSELGDNVGIKVECHRESETGLLTNFRCILPRLEAIDFCTYAKLVSKRNNIDIFLDSLKPTKEEYLLRPSLRLGTDHDEESNDNANLNPSKKTANVITMKRKLRRELDSQERKQRHAQILAKRGAFKILPVRFTNDLVHGSYWYAIGSLFVTLVALIVLGSTYEQTALGTDDSTLTVGYFRAVWILLALSGFFFTLGSIAFIRAMNDPPMKPLFTYYHVCTDALLGAWGFFFGIAPSVPYALIFLIGDYSLQYVGLLIVALISVWITYLFVLACYPNKSRTEDKADYLPYFRYFCCRQKWVEEHCANDFLTACWLIFWGTLLGTVLSLLYTLYGFAINVSTVSDFVNITGFIGTCFFLVGSAYFVAGAYNVKASRFEVADASQPNQLVDADDEDEENQTDSSGLGPNSPLTRRVEGKKLILSDSFA